MGTYEDVGPSILRERALLKGRGAAVGGHFKAWTKEKEFWPNKFRISGHGEGGYLRQ